MAWHTLYAMLLSNYKRDDTKRYVTIATMEIQTGVLCILAECHLGYLTDIVVKDEYLCSHW